MLAAQHSQRMLSCLRSRDHEGKGLEAKLNEKLSEPIHRGLCRGSRPVKLLLKRRNCCSASSQQLSEPAVPGCGQASSF